MRTSVKLGRAVALAAGLGIGAAVFAGSGAAWAAAEAGAPGSGAMASAPSRSCEAGPAIVAEAGPAKVAEAGPAKVAEAGPARVATRSGPLRWARSVPAGVAQAAVAAVPAMDDRRHIAPPPAALASAAATVGAVSVDLPPVPISKGRSFTLSRNAIAEVATTYVASGGDPADSARFFFGDLAVASLNELADPNVTPEDVRTRLGNLTVSGYFGGIWLRDNLRDNGTGIGLSPVAGTAAVNLAASAFAINLFDGLAAGLTGAATSPNWLVRAAAQVSVPVLLALYGYNRGYTPDKRVDAIVPSIAWNTLNESLYPNNAFKTVIGSELLLALVATGARINNQIYVGIATGALFGRLSATSQALLSNSGPGVFTNNIAVPTLFLQGTPDILFELDASQTNGAMITTSNPAVPVKTTWFCGGHGVCLLPPSEQAPQGAVNMDDTLKWLDQYVAQTGTPADGIPAFQWFDQTGASHSSDLSPFDPAFNNPTPLTYHGAGRSLLLVPLIGGSGPSKAAVPPGKPTTFSAAFALASGSKAWNAVNVTVAPPVGTEIAGSPTLSFSYSGLGTSRTVYAQLVDNATGQVVGNVVTPVPVTLDGQQHTVQIPMADIAYTVNNPSDSMTLQITSSALPYANFTAYGFIKIADVNLDVPTVAGTPA